MQGQKLRMTPRSISHASKAATYLRMSSDLQCYSLDHQRSEIGQYARLHGIDIVREYVDSGKSGLRVRGRRGLQALLADVVSGEADYDLILIYDVSRWGRYQNPDQGAHYEFICRQAGIAVEYCSEPFRNDGSLSAVIYKGLKRVMAAEFSRELSRKTRRAHFRFAQMGFWPGSMPGLGLRRLLIDQAGAPIKRLEHGEAKAIRSQKTVLTWGPADEVALVRRIYHMYVIEGLSIVGIARLLRAEGLKGEVGRPWQQSMVRQILTNVRYTGDLIYGRTTSQLGTRMTPTPPETWVRVSGVVEPIITRQVFNAAKRKIEAAPRRLTDEELLQRLRTFVEETENVSFTTISANPRMPCGSTYVNRFGSMKAAYAKIGYEPVWAVAQRRQQITLKSSYSDVDLLEMLLQLLRQEGDLSRRIIQAARHMPSLALYCQRFGCLAAAYERIGFRPNKRRRGSRAWTDAQKNRAADAPTRKILETTREDRDSESSMGGLSWARGKAGPCRDRGQPPTQGCAPDVGA